MTSATALRQSWRELNDNFARLVDQRERLERKMRRVEHLKQQLDAFPRAAEQAAVEGVHEVFAKRPWTHDEAFIRSTANAVLSTVFAEIEVRLKVAEAMPSEEEVLP